MSADLLLLNPKTPANVAGALRTLHHMDDGSLFVTGNRIREALSKSRRGPKASLAKQARVGRDASPLRFSDADRAAAESGGVPIVIEVAADAIPLPDFIHPQHGLYIFGPEDGGVPDSFLPDALRVVIPARYCLNLSTSVGIVLYDRASKAGLDAVPPLQPGRPSRAVS